ncbi:MAG: acyl--CoA ligase [Deltaproteobacteria bacterium]|nr:acyl--CoA ligase [Deltaproteobacteria bacterium]
MSDSNRIENIIDFTLERNLDAIAMKFKDEVYTYGDLELLSRHMSTWFTAMELKGEPVAFMLPNGFEILITYLACFKSGAVAMPLNRRYAAPELERTLINSEARCLIIELEKLHLLNEIDLSKTSVKKIYLNGVMPREGYSNFYTLLGPAGQYIEREIDVDDPAVILYTSGSTGEPKGVVHSYASVDGILDSTSRALDDINENDRVLVMDPLVHISGFLETFSALYKGATVILDEGFKLDRCIPALVNERPTLLTTHIDVYVKILDSGLTNKDTFGSLRGIYTGGDSLPSAFQQSFYDHCGLVIQLGYGMTEAIWLTINRGLDTEGKGSIGTVLPGVEIRLVSKDGNDVEDGEVGEIWVKGQMVTPGYWKNEEETEKVLEDGWFKTGDLAFRDSGGTIYYSGRIKDIIIRNTSNITPAEVEQALYKNPDVKEAAVIGVEDAEEGHVPVAFVVKKDGSTLKEGDLKEFTATQIAEYKVPAKIYFIEEMPLTSSGKINHKKLYDLLPKD